MHSCLCIIEIIKSLASYLLPNSFNKFNNTFTNTHVRSFIYFTFFATHCFTFVFVFEVIVVSLATSVEELLTFFSLLVVEPSLYSGPAWSNNLWLHAHICKRPCHDKRDLSTVTCLVVLTDDYVGIFLNYFLKTTFMLVKHNDSTNIVAGGWGCGGGVARVMVARREGLQ